MAALQAQVKRMIQLFVCVMAITLNSCVYLVVGGVGAVGGYAISRDTIEGVIEEHSLAEVWNEAINVVSTMGVIEERNDAAGMFIAKIQGAKVTVSVIRLSEDSVKLSVKCRKAFLPKIAISEDVYLKIHKNLQG